MVCTGGNFMSVTLSAQIFTILTFIIIVFQAALAAGMPWGAASMGGKFKGKYPPNMRVVAVINMVFLAFLIFVVLSKAGLYFAQYRGFSEYAIWFVVSFSVVGTVLNTITPSKIERIWVPVVLGMLITSVIVAVS